MDKSRRKFLRLASISALGMGAVPALARAETSGAMFTEVSEPTEDLYMPTDQALTATHWGMVIDTTKFHSPEDFKPLIEACHKQHNVPDIGNDQEIKWIWTASWHEAFTEENPYLAESVEERQFLLLCNHCESPACVRVCPTKATFKRESDGIVLMDMHRCIGCRFCMAACPYGARSFNFGDPRPYISEENPDYPTRTRGVVEKCNFCAELLAKGEEPACVQASNGALIFGDLDDPRSEIRQVLKENFTIRRKASLGTQPSVYYII